MRVGRAESVELVLRSGDGVGGQPSPDAADRRRVHVSAVQGKPADNVVAAASRRARQSQAGSTLDAADGAGSGGAEAADDLAKRVAQRLSIFASRPGNPAAKPGVGDRCYLRSLARRLAIPGGDPRLV